MARQTSTARRLGRLLLLATLLLPSPLFGQADAPVRQPTLLVNASHLDDSILARLMTKLSSLSPPEAWTPVRVLPGDTLFSVIARRYRYSDRMFPATSSAIVQVVLAANGLSNPAAIRAGRVLRLPPLPARPHDEGASFAMAQVVQPMTASVGFGRLDALFGHAAPAPPAPPPAEAANAATIAVPLEPGAYQQLLESLPPDARRLFEAASYYGPQTDRAELRFDAPRELASLPSAVRAPSGIDLSTLSPASAGRLYLLDFFTARQQREHCPHGNRVREVAWQVLRMANALHLRDRVVTIDFDFRNPASVVNKVIETYVSSQKNNDRRRFCRSLVDANRRLLQSDPNPYAVPVLFLQILYEWLLSQPDVSVVSSSFYTRIDPYRLLPSSFRPDSVPVLFSAVSDSFRYIEEVDSEEPASTFWNLRNDYGVVLVGAETPEGLLGMTSRDGDGVTAVGPGAGWGETGDCLTPIEAGTSYATPAVATQLFLARALWRSRGLALDTGREAKVRIAMAGDIKPSQASSYASGGIPSLGKLLADTDYVVDAAGRVLPARVRTGFLETRDPSGATITMPIRRGPNAIAALQWVADELYSFCESTMHWQRADAVGIGLTIDVDGVTTTFQTLSDVRRSYSQVAVLKR